MKKGDKMPSGFVLGKGRQPLNLTESQIRYAMKNSKSNSGAARFLNISLTTYQKYSKRYIDEETGKTLWDLQKNKRGKGVKKPYNVTKGKYALKDILDGKYPKYSVHQLKRRLINNCDKVDFPHKCLCYNCFHNLKGNLRGSQPRWRVEQVKKAKQTIKQKKE